MQPHLLRRRLCVLAGLRILLFLCRRRSVPASACFLQQRLNPLAPHPSLPLPPRLPLAIAMSHACAFHARFHVATIRLPSPINPCPLHFPRRQREPSRIALCMGTRSTSGVVMPHTLFGARRPRQRQPASPPEHASTPHPHTPHPLVKVVWRLGRHPMHGRNDTPARDVPARWTCNHSPPASTSTHPFWPRAEPQHSRGVTGSSQCGPPARLHRDRRRAGLRRLRAAATPQECAVRTRKGVGSTQQQCQTAEATVRSGVAALACSPPVIPSPR